MRNTRRYNNPDDGDTITASRLKRSGGETQLNVMRAWFFENYENPIENTPYETAEGGYIYIFGGPYDAHEELGAEFGGLISDKTIQELADELNDISSEWTGHQGEEDEYVFESIAETSEHQKTFDQSVNTVVQLLAVKITGPPQKHLRRLLFVNVITALETYLSDLFISAVGNDKALLRRFVETTPEFRSEKIAYSEVFKAAEEIEKKAKSYLIDVVWHHLNRVKPMFKETLKVNFPDDMTILFKAVRIRHDLVHRNGKRKEGGEHDISPKEVNAIIEQARSFVVHIDSQWTDIDKASGFQNLEEIMGISEPSQGTKGA